MKLSLLTYSLAKSWSLPKVISAARACGFAGLEFRAEAGHQHGVEIDRTKPERREIRTQIKDAFLDVACIGTGSRFESPELARAFEDPCLGSISCPRQGGWLSDTALSNRTRMRQPCPGRRRGAP